MKFWIISTVSISPALSEPRTSGTAPLSRPRPKKRSPNPISTSPKLLYLFLPTKKKGSPTPIMGRAILAMLNFPMMAMIHAVTVVPKFAPMMTPMDCTRVSRPAFTKLTTSTVVAEDDWIRPVVKSPVSMAVKRFLVMVAIARRILSPAQAWTPSDMIFMP